MKIIKAGIGFILFLIYNRKINLSELLRGKRVAIVGAADSALNTGLGEYINGFDCVIRINKAPHIIDLGLHSKDIGTKTDILFHSFYENEKSGGGPLNINLFDELKIRFLINPISNFSGRRVSYNYYKKYLSTTPTFYISTKEFNLLTQELNGYLPTIGFCALWLAVQSQCDELYITGFTFFKTAFAKGYRDEIQQPHEVAKLLSSEGHHDVNLEFELFRKLIKSKNKSGVKMDQTLQNIVDNGG